MTEVLSSQDAAGLAKDLLYAAYQPPYAASLKSMHDYRLENCCCFCCSVSPGPTVIHAFVLLLYKYALPSSFSFSVNVIFVSLKLVTHALAGSLPVAKLQRQKETYSQVQPIPIPSTFRLESLPFLTHVCMHRIFFLAISWYFSFTNNDRLLGSNSVSPSWVKWCGMRLPASILYR